MFEKNKKKNNQLWLFIFTFIECVEYVFHRLSQDVSECELATLKKISKEQGKINSPAAASAYEYLMNSWKEQKGVELRKLFWICILQYEQRFKIATLVFPALTDQMHLVIHVKNTVRFSQHNKMMPEIISSSTGKHCLLKINHLNTKIWINNCLTLT